MPGPVTLENLDEVFTYHKPDEERARKHEIVNKATKDLARLLLETCPACADRSAAIRAVREVRLWANSSIALNGEV